MPDLAKEISSINFGSIIGGSLNAIVEAQCQSANTTVDFIRNVCFQQGENGLLGEPIYVKFRYDKVISPYQPDQAAQSAPSYQPLAVQKMELEVPVLTMMPLPFIKIAEATIDFNVKINSVTTTESKQDSSYGGSLDVSTSFSFWRFKTTAKLNATLSNQKSSSNSEEVKRDYSLNLHIRVVQEDMPEGTARLLDILQDSITSRPVDAATPSVETKTK